MDALNSRLDLDRHLSADTSEWQISRPVAALVLQVLV